MSTTPNNQGQILKTKYYFILFLMILVFLFLAGCSPVAGEEIQIVETKVESSSVSEVILIDNCDSTNKEKQQLVSRSFDFTISDVDTNNLLTVEQQILINYNQVQDKNITLTLTASSKTKMQFIISYTEKIRTGEIVIKNTKKGFYGVHVPISIDLISKTDVGCSPPTATPYQSIQSTATKSTPIQQTSTVPFKTTVTVLTRALELSYCTQKKITDCIYQIREVNNNTLSIYFNTELINQQNSYCSADGKQYKVIQISGYKGKFVCQGLPVTFIGQEISMQVFVQNSPTALLEGLVFFDKRTIFPTETPNPPNPYIP